MDFVRLDTGDNPCEATPPPPHPVALMPLMLELRSKFLQKNEHAHPPAPPTPPRPRIAPFHLSSYNPEITRRRVSAAAGEDGVPAAACPPAKLPLFQLILTQ